MAIALDSATNTTASAVSSVTLSHPCTGSNLLLAVTVTLQHNGATTSTISGVTYNGVAMTLGAVDNHTYSSTILTATYYLTGPSLGTNNVVVTLSDASTLDIIVGATSFTGVLPSSPINGTFSGGNFSSPATHTVTTTVANSWIIGALYTYVTSTAGTGETQLYDTQVNGNSYGSAYYKPTTTTGSQTVSEALTGGAADWSFSGIAFAPALPVNQRTATTANTGAAAAISLTVNKPAGTTAGDLLLTEIAINNGSSASITTLSGWTLLNRTNNTTVLGQAIYYRIADGSEGSTFTWAFTSEFASIVCNAYTGVDNNNPFAGITALGKTSASTSATFGACIPQAESVYPVLFVTSRNTTAAQHITASSGWTVNGDTATTATTFIEAAMQDQHTALGLPLASLTPGSATFSTSSTDVDTVLYLRPTVTTTTGGFSIDVSTFASELTDTGGTVTTAAFSTGYANEVIFAVIAGDSGASSVMGVSGGGLTWHAASSFVNARQDTFVFWALAASKVTGITVTATDSGNTSSSWGLHVFSVLGTNTSAPVGATLQVDPNATGAFTGSVTTTGANSWVWLAWNNYSANTTPTVGTGQTKVNDIANASDGNRYSTTRQTAVTASSGTSVTMNNTAPTVTTAGILFEIMAATTTPTNLFFF